MTKVMIGIPAYNEEKNIGKLLNDILCQKVDADNFIDIIVVSDMSNDDTDNIVSSLMKKYDNVKLIRKNERTGKSSSLNIIFDMANGYDILILFDADIRLGDNVLKLLIEKITISDDIGLVGGNPIPFPSNILNLAEQAQFFGWALVDMIKNLHEYSLYHPHGRILALTKKLYSDMRISVGIGNDTYIYLYCMKKKLKFKYAHDAIVYFESPKTIDDYLKQSVRRSTAVKENEKIFGKNLIKDHAEIHNMWLILLNTIKKYPYKFLCWSILYTYGQLLAYDKKKSNPTWKISNSTK